MIWDGGKGGREAEAVTRGHLIRLARTMPKTTPKFCI